MQQRHELRVAAAARVEPELLGHGDRERDDIAAVRARVGVVGLDDVPEQKRRAAIRMAELERMIDAAAPLARERAQKPDEREHEQECGSVIDRREGGEQPDREQASRPRPTRRRGLG